LVNLVLNSHLLDCDKDESVPFHYQTWQGLNPEVRENYRRDFSVEENRQAEIAAMNAGYTTIPASGSTPKKPHLEFKTPKLLLKIDDLTSRGTRDFLTAINAGIAFEECVQGVVSHLYNSSSSIPPTRSVTLILRSMPGVAYTTGSDLDDDHKEIHFSTDYIKGISQGRKNEEILGVLRHEMVHCYQWNAYGTAPGGLIEGIADWVRLKSDFVPPHWKMERGDHWDGGYQNTGYFLEYLELTYGEGTVPKVNDALRNIKYEEKTFWKKLFGKHVEALWEDYGEYLKKRAESGEVALKVKKGTEETATKINENETATTAAS
jgi:Peptidase of plants and bacteria